jgi:deazaflavin-dependent oxidoreductase (nitroreductase family)
MNLFHKSLLKITFGKVGWTGAGMPVLELVTTGRKSGQARSVMLTSPLQVDDGIVIVASRGGDDINPAWFHNIVAEPRVEVALQGKARTPMIARVATAEERAEWWPRITAKFKNYASYQTKTTREIPLIVLSPADAG